MTVDGSNDEDYARSSRQHSWQQHLFGSFKEHARLDMEEYLCVATVDTILAPLDLNDDGIPSFSDLPGVVNDVCKFIAANSVSSAMMELDASLERAMTTSSYYYTWQTKISHFLCNKQHST